MVPSMFSIEGALSHLNFNFREGSFPAGGCVRVTVIFVTVSVGGKCEM